MYVAVERGGLATTVGQAIAIVLLLVMIGVSLYILAPVTDAPRDWNALSRRRP
jgi:hypothetical protein